MAMQESNKLIIEFMNDYSGRRSYPNRVNDIIEIKDAVYEMSWDSLMLITEKIEHHFHGNITIESVRGKDRGIHEDVRWRYRCHICIQGKIFNNAHEFSDYSTTKKIAVYEACINFIEWHNENK